MFKKNHEKVGGRKKGSPNKITRDLKKSITDFLECNFDNFQNWFNELDASEKTKIYLSLLEYSVPKIQRVAIEKPDVWGIPNLSTEEAIDFIERYEREAEE
jgi:hypothetical protein